MQQTRILMGMPITIAIDGDASPDDFDAVYAYFSHVDEVFSTYKTESEISRINRGAIPEANFSEEMRHVFRLSEATRKETGGYFNILRPNGTYDPSGLVKGWSIQNAANVLLQRGFQNFYVDAGGDIQAHGKYWAVGIRNPFRQDQIVKVVHLKDQGMATSGTYIRGQHIYNPHAHEMLITDIVSLTVIGPNIYEADRFATAAFAMGKRGIEFIEGLNGFEGYLIDKDGIATMTSGFDKYTASLPTQKTHHA